LVLSPIFMQVGRFLVSEYSGWHLRPVGQRWLKLPLFESL
jgi:hypothetical protein